MKYTLLKNKETGERSIYVSMADHSYKVYEKENPEEYAKLRKLALNNHKRASKDDAMRSLGLVKVKGNLGGTYWE